METQIINLFWTSGWDSTYRLVELSRKNVTVQPVYIKEMGRVSEKKELEAMEKILKSLELKTETVAKILPVKFIKFKDIPQNREISDAFNVIRDDIQLGMQYEFLALYAATCPGIEIGCEGGEPDKLRMTRALIKYGGLQIEKDKLYIDSKKATKEGKLALLNFSFPIIDKTEAEMKKNIQDWGYENVMKNIWFCHIPLNDKPCGLCRACEVKMQNDMEFLLPRKAQKRYKVRHILIKLMGKRVADFLCRKIYR